MNLYIYALLAANTLVLYGGLLAISRLRRLCRLHEKALECPPGIALADADDVARGTGRNQTLALARMEKLLLGLRSELQAQAGVISSSPVGQTSLPLANAVRMAKNGATVDDLTRSCGLNVGEAQLIRTMHCQSASSQSLPG